MVEHYKMSLPMNSQWLAQVVAFGICVAVTVGFSIMNGWYIYLISKGMTSVEYKISRAWNGATSPYNRGYYYILPII